MLFEIAEWYLFAKPMGNHHENLDSLVWQSRLRIAGVVHDRHESDDDGGDEVEGEQGNGHAMRYPSRIVA